jgi:hypothetical protein
MQPAIWVSILHLQHTFKGRLLPLTGTCRWQPHSSNRVVNIHSVLISVHSFLEWAFCCAPHPLDTHGDKQVFCFRFAFDTGPAVLFAVGFGSMTLQPCYYWPGVDNALTGQDYERLTARRPRTRPVRDHQTLYRRFLPLQRVR